MPKEHLYSLGHDADEVRRLGLQASHLGPSTERILLAAGIRDGMRVLDVGAGAGGVTLLVAEKVGPSGLVVGIDREATVLDHARAQAAAAGFGQVRFEAATLEDLPISETYDAVVCRNVVCHQRDRVGFLRRAAALVRSGGRLVVMDVALPEPDLPSIETRYRWSDPPVALYDEAMDLCMAAYLLAGCRASTGGHLVRLFDEADLPEPTLIREDPTTGAQSTLVEMACLMLGSLMPILVQHGVTTPEAIGFDTLRSRMSSATVEARSQLRQSNIVGAWVTLE